VCRVVLDASALLAVLYRERKRAEVVAMYLDDAMISSVNLSEVLANALDHGIALEAAREAIARFSFEIVPADEELACVAAELRTATRRLGLSLGDRFCLALALSRKAKVITTDKQWAKTELGIKVVVAE